MLCDGSPAFVLGLNLVGLRRNGIKRDAFSQLKEAYRLLYRSDYNIKQAIQELEKMEAGEKLQTLKAFLLADTSRGISKKIKSKSNQ